MSTPEKAADMPGIDYTQSTIPNLGLSQPNVMPVTLQWNMNPTGPNGYPGASIWNVSAPPQQIIFQNETQQWTIQPLPPPYSGPPVIAQDTRLENLHKTFLKGKPYGLGIVLIVTAILEIFFSIAVPFLIPSAMFISGASFWGPLFYIIAGSLSISAHKFPSVCKVKGALALNIISSICSMITMILSIVDFSIVKCHNNSHNDDDGGHHHGGNHGGGYDDDDHSNNYSDCTDYEQSSGFTLVAFILVMNLLIFCVSVSLSVFGCRAVEAPGNASTMVVIQNDMVISTMPPKKDEDPIKEPPPYEVK